MDPRTWRKVDEFIVDKLIGDDPVLEEVLRVNAERGLPPIDVSAPQGRFLHLLVRMTGAKRLLEVGTLGGYSTICMARALPEDGDIVTLEYEPRHAQVAKMNFERAGVSDRITLHLGAAAETLPRLAQTNPVPFDLVFIDADKPNNPTYLDWAMKLGRPGTVIVLDNVVRDGEVVNETSTDPSVQGTRLAFDLIGASSRLDATALQTVGSKGWDGFAIMILD